MMACEDEVNISDSTSGGNKNLKDAYVTIAINTLSDNVAKSAPTGGEEGDGHEAGLPNEDKINDLLLIFFKGTNLNTALNTEVSEVLYINSGEILPGNTTKTQKVSLEEDIYNLIVLVNTGNIASQLSGKTVKEVSDYLQKSAWTLSGNIYSDFIMSSANEATIDLTRPTTVNSPAVATVDVQRVAARIDVLPNQGNGGTNTYSVLNGSDVIANVTINKVRAVNLLTAGSYLIKRTATTVNGIPVYLGKETPQSGNQTNYVIDPWTDLKTKANLTGGNFNIDMGGAGSSAATALYADYFTNINFSTNDNIKKPLDSKDFYILAYTMENTMDKDNQLNGYSTGIVYETTYIPTVITSYNPSSPKNEEIANTQAITFFTTINNKSIHNTLESVEFPFLEGVQSDDFFSYLFNTGNTWQELKDYSKRIKYNDLLGFKAYLNKLLEGKVLTARLDRNVSWSAFVLESYGYSINNSLVSINQGGINTTQQLSALGIKAYENGLCYYPYWIRHSNDNTIESTIMEFGIVRNNVYKLKVLSFSGLGKPSPYDPDIDNPGNPDEESNIKIRIWVRPWKLILHPEIIM